MLVLSVSPVLWFSVGLVVALALVCAVMVLASDRVAHDVEGRILDLTEKVRHPWRHYLTRRWVR